MIDKNTKRLIKLFKDNMGNVSYISKPNQRVLTLVMPTAIVSLAETNLVTAVSYEVTYNGKLSTGQFELDKVMRRVTKLYTKYKELSKTVNIDPLTTYLESLP